MPRRRWSTRRGGGFTSVILSQYETLPHGLTGPDRETTLADSAGYSCSVTLERQ